MLSLPAAKCNGVDLRPAVSRAFTVCGVINFFTLIMSPDLHASNNSRSGSLAMAASRFTDKMARLRLDIVAAPRRTTPKTDCARTYTETHVPVKYEYIYIQTLYIYIYFFHTKKTF